MRQLHLQIEHRTFSLNIQDEYFDEVVKLLEQQDDFSLNGNNDIRVLLNICLNQTISHIDSQQIIAQALQKISAVQQPQKEE